MHEAILTEEQIKLLPLVSRFSGRFGLVGGTAIALQIGHRRSIDFDLFSPKPFRNITLIKHISRFAHIDTIQRDDDGQFTLMIKGVQFTFFHYPYPIEYSQQFGKIRMPDLLTLAAMKVFALGQRAKWKDYVDLYFILKDYHSIDTMSDKAKALFGSHYNEALIREQLAYFGDINYSQVVKFMPGFELPNEVIKEKLKEISLS